MGKSRRRSKKGAVDEPMTVAQPSGGDGGGWLTGSAISEAMAEDTEGGGVKDAQNAAAPSQRALTAGLGKLKGATDQMGIPGAGLVTMNLPKSVTDQISSLQGSSSVVTGESHFLEVGGLLPSRNTAL